jgi:transposase
MSFVDTFKCVHGANRGHTGTRTNSEGAEEEATASKRQRATRDRGETLIAGASVSRVARRHDVNANQVFYWRKLYREGRLRGSKQLLAVEVTKDRSAPGTEEVSAPCSGSMEIKLAKGSLRVFGSIDAPTLRLVLECLAG